MIRAVIFDMYETLVTMTRSVPYKGTNIAKDLGLAESVFREVWNPSDNERTLGKTTFEDTIRLSMKVNDCFSESLLQEIIRKRQDAEREYFNHLNPGIIPMLQGLKERLYVGDGGSRELETAQAVGMKTVQAAWYLCEGFGQPVGRKPEFEQLEKPEDVLGQV